MPLVHSNVRAYHSAGLPSHELALTARVLTNNGRKALAFFAHVLDDPLEPTLTRLAAASLLLDRGYGKAPVTIDVTTNSPGQQLRAFSLHWAMVETNQRKRTLARSSIRTHARTRGCRRTPTRPRFLSRRGRR